MSGHDTTPKPGTVVARIVVEEHPTEGDEVRRATLLAYAVDLLRELGYRIEPTTFRHGRRGKPPRSRRREPVIASALTGSDDEKRTRETP